MALMLVIGVVFFVFSTNMQSTLRRTEELHIRDLSKVLMAAIDNVTSNMQTNVLAMASWDDARKFAMGLGDRYLVNNMTDFSMLKDYRYTYLAIKDLKGRDLYTMGYDEKTDFAATMPLGFTTKLRLIADRALAAYHDELEVRSTGHKYAGLMLYDDKTYLVCALPITDNLRLKAPVGTFTFALDFTEEYVREFTGLPTLELRIRAGKRGESRNGEPIEMVNDSMITITRYLTDMTGSPLVLTMTYPRTIYSEGSRLYTTTSVILVLLLIVALAAMFVALDRMLITPTRSLADDVMSVSPDVPLDLAKYSQPTELAVLSQSINKMVARLEHNRKISEKDKVSIATFQSIFDSIDACLYVSDPETSDVLFTNATLNKQLGFTEDAIGKKCWSVMWKGQMGECGFCPVKELRVSPNKTIRWETHNPVNDRQYSIVDKLIPWTGGRMVHFQYSQDITDMKAAADDLLRLSSMIESAPQFVMCIDEKNESMYFNPAAQQITGYSHDELIRGGFELLCSPEDTEIIREEVVPSIRASGQQDFEMYMTTKSGERRLMHHYGFKLQGESDGVCSIAVDITETRRLEADLIAAKEFAERSSLAKTDFLSRMSHEMRTPMNAIIGMTHIAHQSDSWERREYCLNKIEGASKHLLGVINDILDMSKIEANKFELSPIDFNFEKVLESVISVIMFKTDEKHQNLTLAIDDNIPSVLHGDEQRLAQVLTNLLINASKFTAEGGMITLSAHAVDIQDAQIMLQIDVTDTGIGISKEQQSRLFKSFEQADGSISRKFGGTGLGLAISKRIVELMGGRIWVESKEGEGSTFSFMATFGRTDADLPSQDEQLQHKGLKVLIVDDESDARDYARHVLAQLGETCDVAASGDEALVMLNAQGASYDIVISDFRMPGMDGIELTRKIRNCATPHPIVIMTSAVEWSEISEAAIDAGVSGFLTKPLFTSHVVQSINALFAVGAGRTFVSKSKDTDDPTRFAGMSVLLAEDVEINREIVVSMLDETGIQFSEVENGLLAVETFSENPEKYDMIIMDIQMPVMDGLEAARRIRALPSNWAKRIPILAMTANAFREDIDRCMEAGMDAHVAKPINLQQLIEALNQWLVSVDDKDGKPEA